VQATKRESHLNCSASALSKVWCHWVGCIASQCDISLAVSSTWHCPPESPPISGHCIMHKMLLIGAPQTNFRDHHKPHILQMNAATKGEWLDSMHAIYMFNMCKQHLQVSLVSHVINVSFLYWRQKQMKRLSSDPLNLSYTPVTMVVFCTCHHSTVVHTCHHCTPVTMVMSYTPVTYTTPGHISSSSGSDCL
jgi:hypothetical protein